MTLSAAQTGRPWRAAALEDLFRRRADVRRRLVLTRSIWRDATGAGQTGPRAGEARDGPSRPSPAAGPDTSAVPGVHGA